MLLILVMDYGEIRYLSLFLFALFSSPLSIFSLSLFLMFPSIDFYPLSLSVFSHFPSIVIDPFLLLFVLLNLIYFLGELLDIKLNFLSHLLKLLLTNGSLFLVVRRILVFYTQKLNLVLQRNIHLDFASLLQANLLVFKQLSLVPTVLEMLLNRI
jgi:hypothetical protein